MITELKHSVNDAIINFTTGVGSSCPYWVTSSIDRPRDVAIKHVEHQSFIRVGDRVFQVQLAEVDSPEARMELQADQESPVEPPSLPEFTD